jgi:hypothetical protein
LDQEIFKMFRTCSIVFTRNYGSLHLNRVHNSSQTSA